MVRQGAILMLICVCLRVFIWTSILLTDVTPTLNEKWVTFFRHAFSFNFVHSFCRREIRSTLLTRCAKFRVTKPPLRSPVALAVLWPESTASREMS